MLELSTLVIDVLERVCTVFGTCLADETGLGATVFTSCGFGGGAERVCISFRPLFAGSSRTFLLFFLTQFLSNTALIRDEMDRQYDLRFRNFAGIGALTRVGFCGGEPRQLLGLFAALV
jgi:hypothetical protein